MGAIYAYCLKIGSATATNNFKYSNVLGFINASELLVQCI